MLPIVLFSFKNSNGKSCVLSVAGFVVSFTAPLLLINSLLATEVVKTKSQIEIVWLRYKERKIINFVAFYLKLKLGFNIHK